MQAPSKDFRTVIAREAMRLRESPDEAAENGIDEILLLVLRKLTEEIEAQPPEKEQEEAEALLSVCHAWASLASHAAAEVYAPNSPFPRQLAGWGSRAINRLNQISSTLRRPLDIAKQRVGAGYYSIGIAFPWGISISFTW